MLFVERRHDPWNTVHSEDHAVGNQLIVPGAQPTGRISEPLLLTPHGHAGGGQPLQLGHQLRFRIGLEVEARFALHALLERRSDGVRKFWGHIEWHEVKADVCFAQAHGAEVHRLPFVLWIG